MTDAPISRRGAGKTRWIPIKVMPAPALPTPSWMPDVMNHNLETVPRLYREARPGADPAHSSKLPSAFKRLRPEVLTQSGLMPGLGRTETDVVDVMRELREQHAPSTAKVPGGRR